MCLLEKLKLVVLERTHLKQKRASKELIQAKDREFDNLLAGSLELMHKYHLMTTCECIGPVTAQIILTFLPELGLVSNKQLFTLVGLFPGAERSHYRKHVRNALFATLKLNRANCLVVNNYYYMAKSRPIPAHHELEVSGLDLVKVTKMIIKILNSMVKNNLNYEEWLMEKGIV